MDTAMLRNHKRESTLNTEFPLVSVVTVVRNAANVLEDTIRSVLNQAYPNVEYIIIDGGSTDGSLEIIKKYADSLTYWESCPDNGIYAAMNKGIVKASGKWINFMNAGDFFFDQEVLERIFKEHNSSIPDCDIVYGNTIYRLSYISFMAKPDLLQTMVKHKPFCHQSSFVRTELLKENGFDESYKISADYASFFSFYKKGFKFTYIDQIISCYDCTDSISARKELDAYREDCRINGQRSGVNLVIKKIKYPFYLILKWVYKILVPKESIIKRKIKQLNNHPNVEWVKRI